MSFVRPQDLTIERVEEALDLPAEQWHGQCYGIASGIIDAKLVRGVAVYGAWLGEINPHGWWADRVGHACVRHGWIRLPRKNYVLDPTRWSFEADEPYLWYGENDGTYDEGNDRFRKLFQRPCPETDPDGRFVELPFDAATQEFLYLYSDKMLPKPNGGPMRVNFMQGGWIANAPMSDLEPFTRVIYQTLVDSGHSAWVPYDNRVLVLGQ